MSADVAQPFTTQLRLSTRLISELADDRSRLRAIAQRSDGGVIVHAGGEVDAANADAWRRLVTEAASAVEPPGSFVIDVNGLEFMGACAFEALAAEAEQCRRRGVTLRLASGEHRLARLVRACGLADLLPVHPTASAALFAAPRAG